MAPPQSIASRQASQASFRPGQAFVTPAKGSVKHHGHKMVSSNASVSSASRVSLSSIDSVIPPPPKTKVNAMHGSTDPDTIHAITQTMIGEYLHKYTRRTIGKGQSGNRHRRFFWVHPYTKTLYWSAQDPGSTSASESSAKSGE
jgi:hypothetical protein